MAVTEHSQPSRDAPDRVGAPDGVTRRRREGPPETLEAELSSALLDVTGPIRRVLRRAVRRDLPEGTIPLAQAEVLGAVNRQPGLRVQEVASALALAPNSVSTLVNHLTSAGLLHRQRDDSDRRSVRLRLTAAGEDVVATRRSFRRETLRRAMADLDDDDRSRIHDALPALRTLADRLEERS